MKKILTYIGIGLFILPVMGATYYVAPDGNDTNSGSSSAEWLTPNFAGTQVVPGDTVIIRDGKYDQLAWTNVHGTAVSNINILAENNLRVIINPEVSFKYTLASGKWVQQGTLETAKSNTPALFSLAAVDIPGDGFDESSDPVLFYSCLVRDQNMAMLPHGIDVYYDDWFYAPNQIYSEDWFPTRGTWRVDTNAVDATTSADVQYDGFWYDPVGSNLYVGAYDPWFKEWMIGTSTEKHFRLESCSYINVVGIYGQGPDLHTARQQGHSSISMCTNVTLTDCKFKFAGFRPFAVLGCVSSTLTRVEFSYGGIQGMGLQSSTNVVFNNCWFHHNGWRGQSPWGVNGGIKAIPNNLNCVIKNSIAEDNIGNGFWWDNYNINCSTIACIGRRNTKAGLFIEMSNDGYLSSGDQYYDNDARGIYISRGNTNTTIVGATCIQNGEGIRVDQTVVSGSNPRTNSYTTIQYCKLAGNTTMDLYLCDPTVVIDSNHSSDHNWFGPNFLVDTPADAPVPMTQSAWQTWGYDLNSNFTDPLPWRVTGRGIEAGWPITNDWIPTRLFMSGP